ncbi:MAG: cytidylyltransferase domain-containing protein [Candidatus Rokuibacteriota bacterium]
MGPTPPGLLILVPARAGSKGVPGKNVKLLGGVPLLGWTARAIRDSGVAARAVLSTDDPVIAEIGRAEGLETPFLRPAELAGDRVDMVHVVEHAVAWLQSQEGWRPAAVMVLQPTCPFRRAARLLEALTLLAYPETEGVVGVARLDRTPAFLYREDAGGVLVALAPWDAATLRQDARPTFTPNGTLYLTTCESLSRHRRLFPPRLRALPTTALEGIDIDTLEDWALAEAIVAAGLAAP